MKALFDLIGQLLSALWGTSEETDTLANFAPRDWADLPVYHPVVDPDPRARC